MVSHLASFRRARGRSHRRENGTGESADRNSRIRSRRPRVGRRFGLGDRPARRDGLADRPGPPPGHANHPGRLRSEPHRLRRRRSLGRELPPRHRQPHRPAYEQGRRHVPGVRDPAGCCGRIWLGLDQRRGRHRQRRPLDHELLRYRVRRRKTRPPDLLRPSLARTVRRATASCRDPRRPAPTTFHGGALPSRLPVVRRLDRPGGRVRFLQVRSERARVRRGSEGRGRDRPLRLRLRPGRDSRSSTELPAAACRSSAPPTRCPASSAPA